MMRPTAISSFDRQLAATLVQPLDSSAAADLGTLALEQQREDDVLPILVAAAERAPRDARLLHVLGLVHRRLGDLAVAVAALDRALVLTPASPRLVHARARCALEAGLPSLRWFEHARRLAPNDGDLILDQAAALLAEGEADAAVALLAAMVRDHPGWTPGHAALIRLRFALDDAAPFADLDVAIAGAPADIRLHLIKITSQHRAGRADDAFAALAAARKGAGDTPQLLAAQAMLSTEHGDLIAADAAFARLNPLDEGDLAVSWFSHLLRRKEPDRLATMIEGSSGRMADVAVPYLSLAWRMLGDPRGKAIDDERFVKTVDFGSDWPLLGPLIDLTRRLHVTRRQPLDQSVRGGTQTDGPLLSRVDPAVRELRDRFTAEVAAYIADLPEIDGHQFLARRPRRPRFNGSWSVRLRDGGYHDPHVHGDGWLSSAFYLATPAATGDEGALVIGEPRQSLGTELPALMTITPRPGRLVLFPSTSWHGTRPFPRGERLTIAFDIA